MIMTWWICWRNTPPTHTQCGIHHCYRDHSNCWCNIGFIFSQLNRHQVIRRSSHSGRSGGFVRELNWGWEEFWGSVRDDKPSFRSSHLMNRAQSTHTHLIKTERQRRQGCWKGTEQNSPGEIGGSGIRVLDSNWRLLFLTLKVMLFQMNINPCNSIWL